MAYALARPPVVGLLALMAVGCGVSELRPPSSHAGPPRHRARLWAGVSEVDITPPIGLGMFGHGPESRVSTGVALRLRCQIFVVTGPDERGRDEGVALVACDLPAPSLYLQRAIAEHVARKHVPLPAHRIALLATHTHFGPNHYFASDGYTGPFSSRRTGLDEEYVKLLGGRIGDGIVEAYWGSRPARIGWAYRNVQGIAQNRSVAPFLQNTSLPPSLEHAISKAPDHPEHAAVDPLLSLMRVDLWDPDTGDYVPTGALGFYGVHPSVISNRNSLYTGDLFGYATREARRRIAAAVGGDAPSSRDRLPVVGLANGIEGDVTTVRGADTHREARRLGRRLGGELAAAWTSLDGVSGAGFATDGPFRVVYRELAWSGARLSNGSALCRHASQGTPAAGGGADHPTSMRIFSTAHAGVRAVDPGVGRRPCAWPRYPLIGLDPDAPPGASYPHIAPIMLARIGAGLVATAPAELTTVTGHRVRDAIAEQLPDFRGRVTVAGLTNEYLGYIATREEYMLQHYEGASTLYGPESALFLREQFACLAAYIAGRATDACGGQGPFDESLPAPYSASRVALLPGKRSATVAPLGDPGPVVARVGHTGERVYSFRFEGPEPLDVREWKDLEVYLERDGVPVADGRDEGFRVIHDDAADGRPWSVEWIAPVRPDDPDCGTRVRLVVAASGQRLESDPFAVDCRLPRASAVWP